MTRRGIDSIGTNKTPLARVFGDQRAVVGIDARRDRRLIIGKRAVVGKILAELVQIEPHAGENRNGEDRNPAQRVRNKSIHVGD